MSQDFGISADEIELIEYGPLMREIDRVIANLKPWFAQSLDMSLNSSYLFGLKSSTIFNMPLGTVVVFGSKSDELSTLIYPLIHSIAGGNYTVLVPESSTSATLAFLEFIINKYLSPSKVYIVERDIKISELEAVYRKRLVDMIFDTRGNQASKEMGILASKHSVRYISNAPGLNIAVVDQTCNIKETAKMISEQKFYKAGQSTDGIDVLYVHSAVQDEFIDELKRNVFYDHSNSGPKSFQHGKILDSDTLITAEKLAQDLSKSGQMETSYTINHERHQMAPLIVTNADKTLLLQKFSGPILPVQTFTNLHELLAEINNSTSRDPNLGTFYYFGNSAGMCEELKGLVSFKQLFYNSTPMNSTSIFEPKFGRFSLQGASASSIFGMHTFTKQKLLSFQSEPSLKFTSRKPEFSNR